jgi:glycosyltransferase involved in cell wall biosynthesis
VKVAYDYQIFISQKFGGVSRYFFELANHLVAFNHERVSCLINSPVYVNGYLRNSNKDLMIKGASVPTIPKIGRIYRQINQHMSPIAFLRWWPDIVHETYYSPKSVAPTGSKIVLTVYDMIHELYPDYFSARDRTREYKKIAVERADHIICISENTQNDLIRLLGVAPEKTTVVHLGFALIQFDQAVLALQNRPFILYVGSRGGYKNFERLLAAYAAHPELRDNYDLIAFGGGAFKPQELELIRCLHVPLTQVRQMGGDDGLLAALYRQAAMFVYPSLYEGFGIPPLEAMSFNCPVACSSTSSIPEIVGNAAIQFDPLDTDSIANALVSLTSDSALRAKLIELGRARVAKFSWEQCAKQTLDVYQDLLQ